jgi:hypothetical protein
MIRIGLTWVISQNQTQDPHFTYRLTFLFQVASDCSAHFLLVADTIDRYNQRYHIVDFSCRISKPRITNLKK